MSEELLSDAVLSRLAVDVLTLETPVAAERRVQHDAKGDHAGYRLGAAEILANDRVVLP